MKHFSLVIWMMLIFILSGCSYSKPTISKNIDYMDENVLWSKVMKEYLKDPLWTDRDMYDAGHNLMVPLHASFKKGNEEWIADFDTHFQKFLREYHVDNEIGLLNKLHYYFVVSRYLALLSEYEYPLENYHLQLANLLKNEVEELWQEDKSWHWQHEGFKGIKQRLEYKLELTEPRFSYDRVIIDEELFLVSIASDLKYFYDRQDKEELVLRKINEYGQRIFIEEGQLLKEGGWIFQKNAWRDHPDYAYTGYHSIEDIKNEEKKVSESVNTDSSHGTRFPLQIYSVLKATDDIQIRNKLQRVYANLEVQFYEKMLKYDREKSVYVLSNFLDGSNGVYRYNYETNKGTGYGPFSLSGILMIGWYNFLNTERVSQVFEEMSIAFPINERVYSKYYLDKTNRKRHPLVQGVDAYYNGLYQLILLLSSEPLLK